MSRDMGTKTDADSALSRNDLDILCEWLAGEMSEQDVGMVSLGDVSASLEVSKHVPPRITTPFYVCDARRNSLSLSAARSATTWSMVSLTRRASCVISSVSASSPRLVTHAQLC